MNLVNFYSNFTVTGPYDCWIYKGTILKNGYGQIYIGKGLPRLAHRISYMLFVGKLLPGHEIDHVKSRGCTSRACVNPNHLEQVAPDENDKRRRRSHCKRGHEYAVTGEYISYKADGVSYRSHQCKQCHLDRRRKVEVL